MKCFGDRVILFFLFSLDFKGPTGFFELLKSDRSRPDKAIFTPTQNQSIEPPLLHINTLQWAEEVAERQRA